MRQVHTDLVLGTGEGDTGKLPSGKGTWEAMTMAYTEEDYTQASVGLTFAGSTAKANYSSCNYWYYGVSCSSDVFKTE